MKDIMAGKTKLCLLQGDITAQDTDAIVNAANSGLMGGGGVDGSIHRAGGPKILEECRKIISRIGRLDTGKAVITTGGNLKAKYVIHTVGPVWRGGNAKEQDLLASAYTESLRLATAYKLKSIAFPSISTGAYGYPLPEAASVALRAVVKYLHSNNTTLETVCFVLFDSVAFNVYGKILEKMENLV